MSKCTLTPKQKAIGKKYGHLFFFAGKDPVKMAELPESAMWCNPLTTVVSTCAYCQILLVEKLIDEGLLVDPTVSDTADEAEKDTP